MSGYWWFSIACKLILRVDIFATWCSSRMLVSLLSGEFKVSMSWFLQLNSGQFQIDYWFLPADIAVLIFASRYWRVLQYRPFVKQPSRIRANSYEIFPSLSNLTNFVRIWCTKFTCEFAYEFVHEFAKTKEKIRTWISEFRARMLKAENNLWTNLNKPTRLHQDRNSKTSSSDN